MNKEKVLELAKQVGLEYNFDPMLWLKYEEFAELIIQECIQAIEDAAPKITSGGYGRGLQLGYDGGYGRGLQLGYDRAILALKNRFGVE